MSDKDKNLQSELAMKPLFVDIQKSLVEDIQELRQIKESQPSKPEPKKEEK
ncbi:MAG: hypothetical protein ACI9CD_000859 [Candidatus Deianiraeaceae bacterium]|jgi:hypothetical protein